LPGLLLFAAGILLTVALALNYQALFGPRDNQKARSAAAIGPVPDLCARQGNITYSCYKKELTDLTNANGPETAVALVKQQYDKNPYVKSQCHSLTHAVGRAALSKYKDIAITFAHGDHFCASGYYHGTFEQISEERGADYLIKNANKICVPFADKNRYHLDHYNCVHGVGHGLLGAAGSDLFKALKACDKLADTWERSSCHSGVFMQNVMIEQSPDESVNRKSAFLRREEPMYPCTAVADKYKVGCYIFQSSYALTVTGYDYRRVFSLCQEAGTWYQDVCYGSMGRDASGNSQLNQQKTIETCYLGPTDRAVDGCIKGAAKNTVYSYHSDKQAYALCGAVGEKFQFNCRKAVTDFYKTFD
jgi:hypothetical protein